MTDSRILSPASTQYIEANGIRVHYRHEPSEDATPLILLHGGTATLHSWEGHIPHFVPDFNVYALDLRGHGRTINPTDQLSYRLMADDVAAFIQALKLTKPIVMGYSDGAQIALELGTRYGAMVGALVLGGVVYRFTDSYFDALKAMGVEQTGVVDTNQLDADWIAFLETAHLRDDDPQYWRSLLTQLSIMWWTPLEYTMADLQAMTTPALIIAGDRDQVASLQQAVKMYQNIPNAALAILPNADHATAFNSLSSQIVLNYLLKLSRSTENERG